MEEQNNKRTMRQELSEDDLEMVTGGDPFTGDFDVTLDGHNFNHVQGFDTSEEEDTPPEVTLIIP